MKKHIVVALLLLTVLYARPSELFAACDAKLTLDLEKQSRDYFTNGQVSVLQNFLKDQGFFQSDVTGFFGDDTYAAVRGYQNARGINPASGFVGYLTRGSMNAELCVSPEITAIDRIIADNRGAVLGAFTIGAPGVPSSGPTLTAISPNGGDVYKNTSGKMKVKWSSRDIKKNADISIAVRGWGVFTVPGEDGQMHEVSEYDFALGNSKNDGVQNVRYDLPDGKYQLMLKTKVDGQNIYDFGEGYFIVGKGDQSSGGYAFNFDLMLGSTGPDVVALQDMLIAQGYLVVPPGATKGYFGVQTQTAVARWQAANGIYPADGYFGAVSRAKANQVVCVSNCEQDVVITVSTPTTGATYGFDDNVTLNWTASNGNFDYYNIYLGVARYKNIHVISQKNPKTDTSFSMSPEDLLQIAGDVFGVDYTYSDKYGTDILKDVYFRVEAVRGIPDGEISIATGESGYFNLVTEGDSGELSVSSMEIDGLKKTYTVGESVTYKVEGILSNVPRGASDTAKPGQGFGARAAIEEYDAVGQQWFVRSNLINTADMYATGVWDGRDRWDIKMKAPLDATKTYRVRTIVYCADKTRGCVSGAGNIALSHEPITVKSVVTPPSPSIDAQVRTILYDVKSVADKYYAAHNNSYWGSVAGQDVCDVTGEYTVGAYMEEMAKLGGWYHEKDDHSNEANSTPSRVRVWCHVSAQEWAIVVPMKDPSDAFQCVDSRGARVVVDNLPANQNYCPENTRG